MLRINQISNTRRIQSFRNQQGTISLLLTFVLLTMLVACNSQPRPIEDEIRLYLYENQTDTGQQFVRWADKNLSDYSSRQIDRALYNEGKSQAKQGHPNAVVALSFAAQAWAEDNGLSYKYSKWHMLHQEAIDNLRDVPNGKLQLWSPE